MESNFYKTRKVRVVRLNQFGSYNWDIFKEGDQRLMVNYKAPDQVDISQANFFQFDLTADQMVAVPNKEIQFNKNNKNVLVALLENHQVAYCDPSQYQAIQNKTKGSTVDMQFTLWPTPIESAKDLHKVVTHFL